MADMPNWLKAGLIGAAVLVVLSFLGLIPCVDCVTWIIALVTYGCVGALAAYWMPPVRMAGPAAGHGALAAVIAGAIGGAVDVVLGVFQAVIWGSVQGISQLPPQALREMERAGVDPGLFAAPLWAATCGPVLCLIGVALAAGLGALGGVIFAAVKPE